eukprot:COSAG06_NODE_5328_length_3552_cov_5.076417_3_plen_191_part_00
MMLIVSHCVRACVCVRFNQPPGRGTGVARVVSPLRQAHANYGNTHRHTSAARRRRSQSPSAAFARPGERSSGGSSGSTPQPGDLKTITVQGCATYLPSTHIAPDKRSLWQQRRSTGIDVLTCATLFCALLCFALLCCAVLCCAVLCCAVLCCVCCPGGSCTCRRRRSATHFLIGLTTMGMVHFPWQRSTR